MLSLALACSPPVEEAPLDSGAPAEVDTGVSTDTIVEVPPPELLPDEVSAELAEIFAIGLPNAIEQKTTFFDLFSMGDDICPGPGTGNGWWTADACLVGCTAESGYWYLGPAGFLDAITPAEGGGFASRRIFFVADGEIQDPEGHSMGVGGHWTTEWANEEDGSSTFTTSYEGSWNWELGEGWQLEGASGWFDIAAERSPPSEDGGSEISVDIDGVLALGTRAIFFDQIQFDPACGDVPTGALEVRDPVGYWWRVEFPESCDAPCGPLYFGSELAQDEICVDTGALLSDISRLTQW